MWSWFRVSKIVTVTTKILPTTIECYIALHRRASTIYYTINHSIVFTKIRETEVVIKGMTLKSTVHNFTYRHRRMNWWTHVAHHHTDNLLGSTSCTCHHSPRHLVMFCSSMPSLLCLCPAPADFISGRYGRGGGFLTFVNNDTISDAVHSHPALCHPVPASPPDSCQFALLKFHAHAPCTPC